MRWTLVLVACLAVGASASTGPLVQQAHEKWVNFMENMMGRDWSSFVPAAWSNAGMTLDSLDSFEFKSNMQDFMARREEFGRPESIADLKAELHEVEGIFCKPESFTPSELVYATCVGPEVVLAYQPKVCILDETTKEIVCDPPKIVLNRIPGGCTHKYNSASSWKGKECRISGKAGFSKEITYGGGIYPLPLTSIPFNWWGNDNQPSP